MEEITIYKAVDGTRFDKTIQDEYNDLKMNFNEEYKKLFVKNVKFMLQKIS